MRQNKMCFSLLFLQDFFDIFLIVSLNGSDASTLLRNKVFRIFLNALDKGCYFTVPVIPASAKSLLVASIISGRSEIGTQTSVMTDRQPGRRLRLA